MGAPAVTARQYPLFPDLQDGYQTTIANAIMPNVSFFEKALNPPGQDGGEPIDTTTMLNTKWRTMCPRSLIKLTPIEITAAYSFNVNSEILTHLLNVPTSWTVHFPDTSSVSFFGFLQKATPEQHEEGKQPEMKITIIPTNYDPVGKVEAAPVFTPASGT